MFYDPPPNSAVTDCHHHAGWKQPPNSFDDAQSPWFSIPADVTKVNTAWRSCSRAFHGIFDPPRTLVKTSSFAKMTPESSPTLGAKPGAEITPNIAPTTSTAPAKSPIPSVSVRLSQTIAASVVQQDSHHTKTMNSVSRDDPPSESHVPLSSVALPDVQQPSTETQTQPGPFASDRPEKASSQHVLVTTQEKYQESSGGEVLNNPSSQPGDNRAMKSSMSQQRAPGSADNPQGVVNAASSKRPVHYSGAFDSAVLSASPADSSSIAFDTIVASLGTITHGTSMATSGDNSDIPAIPGISDVQKNTRDPSNKDNPTQALPFPVLETSHSIVAAPNGDVIVASSTIVAGSQASIYGHVVSAGVSNFFIDSNTHTVPPLSPGQNSGQLIDNVAVVETKSPPSTIQAFDDALVIGSSTIIIGEQGMASFSMPSNVVVISRTHTGPSGTERVSQQTHSTLSSASTILAAVRPSASSEAESVTAFVVEGDKGPTGSSVTTSSTVTVTGGSPPAFHKVHQLGFLTVCVAIGMMTLT